MRGIVQGIRETLSNAWKMWTVVASKIASVQARILLTVFYFLALLPFALFVRLLGDPLRVRKRPEHWIDRAQETHDIRWARQL
jgi:hypothetical protein